MRNFRIVNNRKEEEIAYTDGYCFADEGEELKSFPYLTKGYGNFSFYLSEGIWRIPVEIRLCVYTAHQILSDSFLDITQRIIVHKDSFIYLKQTNDFKKKKENVNLTSSSFYTMQFYDNNTVLDLLQTNIHLADSGNLHTWKNKIQLFDLIYSNKQ